VRSSPIVVAKPTDVVDRYPFYFKLEFNNLILTALSLPKLTGVGEALSFE